MVNKQDIKHELDKIGILKDLVEAYEEIAAMRMRKVRSSVLQNREFLSGLTSVFQDVKSSYRKEILRIMKEKKIKNYSKLSLIKRNGKTVAVFVASNTGLYGDIILKTFHLFTDYIDKTKADVTVIGRRGKLLFETTYPHKPFSYFDFPDDSINTDILRDIIAHILEYEKMMVFYGQFHTIVSQKATMLDMYGNFKEEETEAVVVDAKREYIFEPSLENVMVFFEAEIFTSIFEQTIHESDLAKYAARMFTLDRAAERINSRYEYTRLTDRILSHRAFNKKQLDSLAGMALWRAR